MNVLFYVTGINSIIQIHFKQLTSAKMKARLRGYMGQKTETHFLATNIRKGQMETIPPPA